MQGEECRGRAAEDPGLSLAPLVLGDAPGQWGRSGRTVGAVVQPGPGQPRMHPLGLCWSCAGVVPKRRTRTGVQPVPDAVPQF